MSTASFNDSCICRLCHHTEWREVGHHYVPVRCNDDQPDFGRALNPAQCTRFESRVDWARDLRAPTEAKEQK